MKKIMVKYNLEIPEDKFEKACKKVMIGKKEMIKNLRDRAEIHGRVTAYEFVDNLVNKKEDS